jgi:hypothetical protein
LANQCEEAKDFKGAFEYYTKALDIFAHMIKCKFNLPHYPLGIGAA